MGMAMMIMMKMMIHMMGKEGRRYCFCDERFLLIFPKVECQHENCNGLELAVVLNSIGLLSQS